MGERNVASQEAARAGRLTCVLPRVTPFRAVPVDDVVFTKRIQSAIAHGRTAARYVLAVESGPDAGASFRVDGSLERSRLLIGHGPLCDIRLNDPKVSRRHAGLEADERGLRYTDLGSTNGSRVNGVTVVEAFLRGGETIEMGSTVLTVHAGVPVEVALPDALSFGKFHGASPQIRRLYPLFHKLAASDLSVIIEGETGSGKEVLAESLHDASARSNEPFVVFDCTTVSPNLIEAALFGHERGAYTGAVSAARGLFEEADGGTLFIDEIGDLELSLQAKLLRAVDKSSVRRIGGTRWIDVDVRIISATRRNLDAEVQAGRFRDDLLFRLGGARIDLPPLRARDGDIRLLAMKFWCELGGDPAALRSDLVDRLEGYAWPGNTRELRHAIVRYLALGDESLTPSKLSQVPQASREPRVVPDLLDAIIAEETTFAAGRQRLLDEFERRFVTSVLERHGGHVGKAAEAAGVGRRYFQEIRNRHREGR